MSPIIHAYWYNSPGFKNVGDTLTPIIVEHYTRKKIHLVPKEMKGKLLSVGSIMKMLRPTDVVWGTGIARQDDSFPIAKQCKFLAVRGKLTEKILGLPIQAYGDPALLLPLIYNPNIDKTKNIGYVPHYIDQQHFKKITSETVNFIDVKLPWKQFIDKLLQYKLIRSSSLHGVIIAEAYGIRAEWVKYSNQVIGNGFKFRDYLTGTNRQVQEPGLFPPIKDLVQIQQKLIHVLQDHYK